MSSRKIKTVTVVGTGLIGASWAARFIHKGINVIATDIDAGAEKQFRHLVENGLNQMDKLIASDPKKHGTLRFTTDFNTAVAKADFIQENTPERLDLKRALIKQISEHCENDVIIASSSSYQRPTDIQADAINPSRIIIGHPFNPVYICPIVELVMGEQTSQETLDSAKEFYTEMGMHPLHVKKEIKGYIGNRIQEAIWRECLYMLRDGVATPKDIDDSIIYGFGIRLAFMGNFMVAHLGGGSGGIAHYIDHFGIMGKEPLSYLIGPDITPELRNKMIDGMDEITEGRSIEELEAMRDNSMIEIIKTLSKVNCASGKVLNEDIARMRARGLLE